MKILYLLDDCPPESFGGAGIVAFEQIKGIARLGHEVLVVTTTRDRSRVGRSAFDGITIERIYSRYDGRWQAYLSLYNPQVVGFIEDIIKKERPDLVHAHNIHHYISYGTLRMAKRYAPVCLTMRDAMAVEYGKLFPRDPQDEHLDYRISVWKQIKEQRFWWNPLRNMYIRHILVGLDGLYVPSEALKMALEQNGLRVTSVLREGVNLNEFQVSKQEEIDFKHRYDLAERKVLLFGGRISTAKGALAALEILNIAQAKNSSFTLLLVGKKDQYIEDFMKEAEKRGFGKYVTVTGWLGRTEMLCAYAASEIVLVLSQYLDPFPTINLEAMAMAKPIIGTRFGGTPEAVIDGVTGLIIDPYRVEASASRIEELLEDSSLQMRYGLAGRKVLEEKFLIPDTVLKVVEEYKRIKV
jgi:glycosyltransferase involved in cell wall biosynthesis